MRILLDVMGGDHPSHELVKGGVAIGRRRSIDVVFAGDSQEIKRALSDAGEKPGSQFDVLPSTQTIRMEDAPVKAVREKKDSSLVLGLNALKQGDVEAFVSPGNTGAVVAGSIFIVDRIPEIHEYVERELAPDSYITEIAEERVELGTVGARVTPDHRSYAAAIDYLIARIREGSFSGISRVTQSFRVRYYELVKRFLETGREIMNLGVVPAANMLPEVAYMKLCWALGQSDDRDEVERIMLSPVNGETTEREPYNGYLIFQGAIPEVQEFLKTIKR